CQTGRRARGEPRRQVELHRQPVRDYRPRAVADAPARAHGEYRDARRRGRCDVGHGRAGRGDLHEDSRAQRRVDQPADAARRDAEAGDDPRAEAGARPVSLSVAAIRCTSLVKRYIDVVAVAGLDLSVEAGECFGLLGPNGAGKTTTIEILEGLTVPDDGEVEVLGMTWKQNERRLRERIGISLQETQLSEKLTVHETVRLFRSFYPAGPDPDSLIHDMSLEEKRNSR